MSGDDQICVTVENGTTNCFTYQRHRTKREQIVITNVKDRFSLNATVEDGIPKF